MVPHGHRKCHPGIFQLGQKRLCYSIFFRFSGKIGYVAQADDIAGPGPECENLLDGPFQVLLLVLPRPDVQVGDYAHQVVVEGYRSPVRRLLGSTRRNLEYPYRIQHADAFGGCEIHADSFPSADVHGKSQHHGGVISVFSVDVEILHHRSPVYGDIEDPLGVGAAEGVVAEVIGHGFTAVGPRQLSEVQIYEISSVGHVRLESIQSRALGLEDGVFVGARYIGLEGRSGAGAAALAHYLSAHISPGTRAVLLLGNPDLPARTVLEESAGTQHDVDFLECGHIFRH